MTDLILTASLIGNVLLALACMRALVRAEYNDLERRFWRSDEDPAE